MTLEESINYIKYCVKEGGADAEQFIGMSNEELIKWADYESTRGDLEAESRIEE